MNATQHRPGVQEVNLVVRHLKLEPPEGADMDPLLAEIDESFGVDAVSYDAKSHMLHLAYDASHCGLDGIEELIGKHGVVVAHDWWTRFKDGYYKFVDQNVKDNAAHQPWSCHKPPPGARGK